LEADLETGRLESVWGYFPREGWKSVRFSQPSAPEGSLEVIFDRTVEAGSSYSLGIANVWPRLFDEQTGWVVARTTQTSSVEYVEFLRGVLAGLAEDRLVELWLHPIFVDTLGDPEDHHR
jgi:hypothetical protein